MEMPVTGLEEWKSTRDEWEKKKALIFF